jgi:DNA-binding response OmpR family regulator
MSSILLVDDSPHAQRIGERILADEGFEVVTVSNADSALIRLEDVDPDVLIAKAQMPGRSGYDICRFVKMNPRQHHVKVILTSGVTETLDAAEVERAGADSTLKKPFEATALLAAVRPLAEAAARDRSASGLPERASGVKPEAKLVAPMIAVIDPEQVRAAVTVALDASMEAMVDEITKRVLAALTSRRPTDRIESRPALPPPTPAAAPAPPIAPAAHTVRPVTRIGSLMGTASRQPVRVRPASILGLDLPPAAPQGPEKPGDGENS